MKYINSNTQKQTSLKRLRGDTMGEKETRKKHHITQSVSIAIDSDNTEDESTHLENDSSENGVDHSNTLTANPIAKSEFLKRQRRFLSLLPKRQSTQLIHLWNNEHHIKAWLFGNPVKWKVDQNIQFIPRITPEGILKWFKRLLASREKTIIMDMWNNNESLRALLFGQSVEYKIRWHEYTYNLQTEYIMYAHIFERIIASCCSEIIEIVLTQNQCLYKAISKFSSEYKNDIIEKCSLYQISKNAKKVLIHAIQQSQLISDVTIINDAADTHFVSLSTPIVEFDQSKHDEIKNDTRNNIATPLEWIKYINDIDSDTSMSAAFLTGIDQENHYSFQDEMIINDNVDFTSSHQFIDDISYVEIEEEKENLNSFSFPIIELNQVNNSVTTESMANQHDAEKFENDREIFQDLLSRKNRDYAGSLLYQHWNTKDRHLFRQWLAGEDIKCAPPITAEELLSWLAQIVSCRKQHMMIDVWNSNAKLRDLFFGKKVNFTKNDQPYSYCFSHHEIMFYFNLILSNKLFKLIEEIWNNNDFIREAILNANDDDRKVLIKHYEKLKSGRNIIYKELKDLILSKPLPLPLPVKSASPNKASLSHHVTIDERQDIETNDTEIINWIKSVENERLITAPQSVPDLDQANSTLDASLCKIDKLTTNASQETTQYIDIYTRKPTQFTGILLDIAIKNNLVIKQSCSEQTKDSDSNKLTINFMSSQSPTLFSRHCRTLQKIINTNEENDGKLENTRRIK